MEIFGVERVKALDVVSRGWEVEEREKARLYLEWGICREGGTHPHCESSNGKDGT